MKRRRKRPRVRTSDTPRRFVSAIGAKAQRRLLGGLLGSHMDFAALEFDDAVFQGEDRVVATEADVEAGVELGSALADDDGAGGDGLSAVGFDAAVLRVAVAAVLGGALT